MKYVKFVALGAVALSAMACQAFTLVSQDRSARIVVGEKEPESVWLAAADLTNDVKQITGRSLALVRGDAANAGDVFISTDGDGRWEAYLVRECDGVLRVSGSDSRGTMFGVYDFIERYLGVDPMRFWSDVRYPKRKTLAWDRVEIVQGEPSLRFRGWFINDEDLLTMWKNASGIRDYSTYNYYNDVINHGAMEAIVESLVRLRMNLIIPASLLNISRAAEEGLVKICARRGVFVSMHHIEPMGVSGFAFKDYWKKRGRDLEFSYFKHPKEMEEVWREMVGRWAKYPNVIWQIGLRGTGDRPMWDDDPSMPADDAGRAALISAALERQLAILDEVGVPREGRIVSTTLWAEGAYFFSRGLLKIPSGTIIVMADNNCGWKWQKDLLEGERQPDLNYGVYYHHGLIGMGPHLVSLIPAAKTHEMLKTARAKGAARYAIFNVGNVREFVYGLDATAKMTWNLDAFDPVAWSRAWLARRVPSNATAWETVLNVYHRSLQLSPATGVPLYLDGQLHYDYYRRLMRIQNRATGKVTGAPDPEPSTVVFPRPQTKDPFRIALYDTHPLPVSPGDTYVRLAAQKAGYEQTLLFARQAMKGTSAAERQFARDFLVYPAELMLALTDASMASVLAEEAIGGGERQACVEHLEAAAVSLRKAIEAGEEYCHGVKWSEWYRGCNKVSPRKMFRRTRQLLDSLR